MNEVPEHAADAVQQVLLGDAVAHAKLGVFVWNAELRYIAVNEEAARLVGVSRETLLGAVVGKHNPDGAPAMIQQVLDRVPSRGHWTTTAGLELDWLVVETTAAGLPYYLGIMWEADAGP